MSESVDRSATPMPAGPGANQPHADPAALRAATDPAAEEDLWQGNMCWRAAYPALVVWLIVGIVVVILALGMGKTPSAAYIAAIVCGALMVLLVIRAALLVWGTHYRLTTQRLFVRRGILTRTVDQTELMRVDDVKTRQTLFERMLGVGEVELFTSDRSDAHVKIVDVDNPDQVAEHVRRYARAIQQKRTMFVEQL
jgi:membrane protein YdbS with pleckstrin-like domain